MDEFDKTVSSFSGKMSETKPVDPVITEEEDEFDRTVSAFSGAVPKPQKIKNVEEEVLVYEEEEEDDFDRTVSAFSAKKPVQNVQKTQEPKTVTVSGQDSFWSSGPGILLRILIFVALCGVGVLLGPVVIATIPLAIWLVFFKLK